MKAKKVYRAKSVAELSLQFYRDREGTPNFLITCNPSVEGKDFCTGIDVIIFAENLIDSGRCSVNELMFFCKMFDIVRAKLEAKVRRA